MKKGFLLGIDAGSSLCKAALFDETGTLCGLARERTPLSRPQPNQCEMDPEQSWNAVLKVICEVITTSNIDPSEVRGIGISAAMVGAWFLDETGAALRPGINWEDSRSQSFSTPWRRKIQTSCRRFSLSSGSRAATGLHPASDGMVSSRTSPSFLNAPHTSSATRTSSAIAPHPAPSPPTAAKPPSSPATPRARSRSDDMIAPVRA